MMAGTTAEVRAETHTSGARAAAAPDCYSGRAVRLACRGVCHRLIGEASGANHLGKHEAANRRHDASRRVGPRV